MRPTFAGAPRPPRPPTTTSHPTNTHTHTHARAHRPPAGLAHTFFVGANDKPRAGELINVLREAKQAVPEELLKFGTTGACPLLFPPPCPLLPLVASARSCGGQQDGPAAGRRERAAAVTIVAAGMRRGRLLSATRRPAFHAAGSRLGGEGAQAGGRLRPPGACALRIACQPAWLPFLAACLRAVKKKESKLYGAHFKDVDHTQKATKVTFDSDDE